MLWKEQELINKTKDVLNMFYGREMKRMDKLLDNNLMWIGSYQAQFTTSKKDFFKMTESQFQEKPSNIYNEHLFIQEFNDTLCIINGKYDVSSTFRQNRTFKAHMSFTIIWKKYENTSKIILIHANNARDTLLEVKENHQIKPGDFTTWFDYVQQIELTKTFHKKIIVTDFNGRTHYLSPYDIVYIEAQNKGCNVHCGSKTISVRQKLSYFNDKDPYLIKVHRSYFINLYYANTLERYHITVNDIEIPVSKQYFIEIRNHIEKLQQTI